MIPIMRPLLPPAKALLPYLERIDANRWYSNHGPLVRELEERLGAVFGAPVVTVSSATSALVACLMALDLPAGSTVAVPSWTFCASVNAIIAAGHKPFLCDTDYSYDIRHDAIMPVAYGGKSFDKDYWEKRCAMIGVPAVVDAASAFDSYAGAGLVGKVPVVISTHCTKVFGTGEGGFVACTDEDFLRRVREICNNGFNVARSVEHPGINGKMSEYHAAVGLAELDGWAQKRDAWLRVQDLYGDKKNWANSTHGIELGRPVGDVVAKLEARGIQARMAWYGVHEYPAYKKYRRTSMTGAARMLNESLFLPKYIGMTRAVVDGVLEALEDCLCA